MSTSINNKFSEEIEDEVQVHRKLKKRLGMWKLTFSFCVGPFAQFNEETYFHRNNISKFCRRSGGHGRRRGSAGKGLDRG